MLAEKFRATYRLQLHKDFQLDQAARVTGYLQELGVSHLYLSPILESRPGSNHGYDGTDPSRISEERGGEEGFEKLIAKVRQSKSLEGVILDIVPNHLAATWRNPYWWDMLEKGPQSKYWESFDVRPRAGGDLRVVLPVLGRSRQALMAARELQLDLAPGYGIIVRYWDNYFPVSARSYPRILSALGESFKEDSAKATEWKKKVASLASKTGEKSARGFKEWIANEPVAARIFRLMMKLLPLKVLEPVLDEQNYVLEEWKSGSRQINYRRFFDINDLAGVRIEDTKTYNWTHAKIFELMEKHSEIHGLRIDHVDGLTDPESYLKRLNRSCDKIWVEKILGDGEHVPKTWPVTGTTGYEFSSVSARLFVDLPGLLHLQSHYNRHIDHRWERFHDCMYDSKREMLESHFVSEFAYLVDSFYSLAQRGRRAPEFSKEELAAALKEVTSSLRVYRSYLTGAGEDQEAHWLHEAFKEVESRGRVFSKPALNWLRQLLLGKGDWSEPTYKAIKRWEQLTGPVMAKGLEDTALYRYFPLLSLNVVGAEPDWVGDGVTEFHAFNLDRLENQPLTMSTTSTHDTKRSEDVRSRIHVISELSEDWTKNFTNWRRVNAKHHTNGVPDLATEYLVYETLLGAWPMNGKIDDTFVERMKQYFMKAVREAKSETSWTEPNQSYEAALMNFVESILHKSKGRDFLKSFVPFAEKCTFFGAFNSLTLVTLKVLSPGLPDFYQGCELWDLSLVDPDNRRPVDYDLRRQMLKTINQDLKTDSKNFFNRITRDWKSGEIKLWLTSQLLRLRRENPELFVNGDYLSIDPSGPGHRQFMSFVRRTPKNGLDQWVLVITPRLLANAMEAGKRLNISAEELLATKFALPPGAPTKWRHAFTGKEFSFEGELTAGEVMQGLPVAVLIG